MEENQIRKWPWREGQEEMQCLDLVGEEGPDPGILVKHAMQIFTRPQGR